MCYLNPVPLCDVQYCLGYILVIRKSAPTHFQSLHECWKSVAKNLWWPGCLVLLQAFFFFWTDAIKWILYKWHPDKKKGSTRSTKTGFGPHRPAPFLWHKTSGVAWFSILLREVCVSAAKFTLGVFLSRWWNELFHYLGQSSGWALLQACHRLALPDPQQLCHHEADRTPLGAHWEVTVQASTTQIYYLPLTVPGAQCTCSTNSSQAEQPRNKKQEKGQTILLLLKTEKFCDLPHRAGKSAVWA